MNICGTSAIRSLIFSRRVTPVWISAVSHACCSHSQNRSLKLYHYANSYHAIILNESIFCERGTSLYGLHGQSVHQQNLSTSSSFRQWSPHKSGWKQSVYQTTKRLQYWLEKTSPTAKKYMDIFENGAKITWKDIQTYRYIRQKRQVNPSTTVSYEDDMAIYRLKQDALKIVPLVPFCVIPFGFILLTIPVYFLPRHVLPHSFWTEEQRQAFFKQMHLERISKYSIVISHLDYVKQVEGNPPYCVILEKILNTVSAGNVPSNSLLLELKPLCNNAASRLSVEIRQPHALLRAFCKVALLNSLFPAQFLCSQLQKHADFIISLDRKLRSRNLLRELSKSEIEIAALMRGLDSINLSKEANIYWLNNWLNITKSCNSSDTWFVLHAMVLLSKNYTEVKYQRKVFG